MYGHMFCDVIPWFGLAYHSVFSLYDNGSCLLQMLTQTEEKDMALAVWPMKGQTCNKLYSIKLQLYIYVQLHENFYLMFSQLSK
jgi:hypothetical protein